MCSAPWKLLHFDADTRMGALELGQELGDDFTLAAHRPEADQVRVIAARCATACNEDRERDRQQRERAAKGWTDAYCADAVSQPPSKPARSRPRRTYGFLRITPQIIALR